ncbi:flagellar P-ring protein FlgI [Vibrio variabilis]|uniref:Flagellar P-ring protein n=1 Tax=Vibrio variabilis TaxID=990271 RepID=A0ABQ0J8L3_9VIBR|nr:flagellar P-ring protein FlgI [Vibrio variabilis]
MTASAIIMMPSAHAEVEIPIMDLVDVQGVRTNQLVGYGLVVGLDGQGDRNQVKFTAQSITNMLRQFGVQIGDDANPKLRNVASVSVTASVDPMAGPGQMLDIVVSSIGDAKSLRGGTLLLTPLRGVDGEVYAVAQGNVVVGGVSAEGRSGSKIAVNTPTAGRVPNGATLEREIPSDFNSRPQITLNLRKASFTTAKNIAREINSTFGPEVAIAVNKVRVDMRAPKDSQQRVTMMSMLEEMSVVEGRKQLVSCSTRALAPLWSVRTSKSPKRQSVTVILLWLSVSHSESVSQTHSLMAIPWLSTRPRSTLTKTKRKW